MLAAMALADIEIAARHHVPVDFLDYYVKLYIAEKKGNAVFGTLLRRYCFIGNSIYSLGLNRAVIGNRQDNVICLGFASTQDAKELIEYRGGHHRILDPSMGIVKGGYLGLGKAEKPDLLDSDLLLKAIQDGAAYVFDGNGYHKINHYSV